MTVMLPSQSWVHWNNDRQTYHPCSVVSTIDWSWNHWKSIQISSVQFQIELSGWSKSQLSVQACVEGSPESKSVCWLGVWLPPTGIVAHFSSSVFSTSTNCCTLAAAFVAATLLGKCSLWWFVKLRSGTILHSINQARAVASDIPKIKLSNLNLLCQQG